MEFEVLLIGYKGIPGQPGPPVAFSKSAVSPFGLFRNHGFEDHEPSRLKWNWANYKGNGKNGMAEEPNVLREVPAGWATTGNVAIVQTLNPDFGGFMAAKGEYFVALIGNQSAIFQNVSNPNPTSSSGKSTFFSISIIIPSACCPRTIGDIACICIANVPNRVERRQHVYVKKK